MKSILARCAPILLLALMACSPESKAPEDKETKKKVTGTFLSVHGESGQVGFGEAFESPPQVTFISGDGFTTQKTIIVETTAGGFKWKNTGDANQGNDGRINWEATGTVKKR